MNANKYALIGLMSGNTILICTKLEKSMDEFNNYIGARVFLMPLQI